MAIGLWAVLCLAAVPVMANSKSFVCVNEKGHLPPLDSQADAW
ncbi:sel1 repeat family protein, partial [Pseudomonas aeruginosa]|nr:sel1 repeat family protein [Pseudomonas aeruginosa]MCR7617472.1 sel1 repeat family protein [Pseudomonas aeruginosa]